MKTLREARNGGETHIGPSQPALSVSNSNLANAVDEIRCRTENSFWQENRWANTNLLKNQYFSTGCYWWANRYAERYCYHLNQRFLRQNNTLHLTNELRRFYRLPQQGKLRRIEKPTPTL